MESHTRSLFEDQLQRDLNALQALASGVFGDALTGSNHPRSKMPSRDVTLDVALRAGADTVAMRVFEFAMERSRGGTK
jgi:hypothetical protein